MRLPNSPRWFQESGNPKTSRLALLSRLVFDLINPKALRPQQQYQQVPSSPSGGKQARMELGPKR